MNQLIPIEIAKREMEFLNSFNLIPPFDSEKAAKLLGIPAQLIVDANSTAYSSSHIALEQFRNRFGLL